MYEHLGLETDVRQRIQQFNEEMLQAVTVALDKAVNGTSLVLMFQIGCTYLLFPGDAQWGTWQMVLADFDWQSLLKQTTIYKVSHHGSHNGTPPQFIDKYLPPSACAMLSVKCGKKWEAIPKGELVTALRKNSPRLVRSDEPTGPLPEGCTAYKGFIECKRVLK